jgi:uncharacterized protein (TIGR04255 family)
MDGTPDSTLPSYQRPPVNEVVCGVQFAPLAGFRSVHFGKYAEQIKPDYPKTEDRDPLVELFEGELGPQVKEEGLIALPMPPLRRVFYIDASGNYLLQLQPSRFIANWRKQQDSDEYPRFNSAFSRFRQGWQTFVSFLRAEDIGIPVVNQYELTYINHILERATPFPEAIPDYLRFFSWREIQSLTLQSPRAATFRLQFPLPNKQGALHLTVNHGKRASDQKGVLMVDLTARGPGRPDWSDMQEWFSVAHATIVNGFTEITTSDAHQMWGRER